MVTPECRVAIRIMVFTLPFSAFAKHHSRGTRQDPCREARKFLVLGPELNCQKQVLTQYQIRCCLSQCPLQCWCYILSSIGLALLGIPFFYIVGIIAGLTNMIPYMGPLIGATVAIIVALMSNHPAGLVIILWIAILFAIVQLIDNILITPIVVSNAVDLHPLVVMIVVLIGGSLLGVTGLIFAIPLTSIFKVVMEELVKGLKSYRIV